MLPSLSISLLGVGAVVAQTQFANLHWPYDPTIEYLEGLLYESTAMSSLAANCVERNDTTVSAQWVRIGYHDMSTHNIHDGTGGLDASIRFELDRGENVGIGMRRSLEDFIALQRTYASMADLIAMGVVLAYPSCGAPFFPSYRAGRVDATIAGPPGVPEPQQDVQTHIEKFANQGFDQSEMIALIACGHAFGGVRKADFDVTGDKEFGLFTGGQSYNQEVVTGYLDGTTPNPLVVGTNETLRTDLRDFGSDGNVTMQKLADKPTFDSTCNTLISRMIDAVPSDVHLTDTIIPIQNKLGLTRVSPSSSTPGSLTLTTSIRMLNPPSATNRTVTLHYTTSSTSNQTISVASVGGGPLGTRGGPGFSHLSDVQGFVYVFNVDGISSISNFWFTVNEDGVERTIANSDEQGYAISQTDILFDSKRSTRRVDTTKGDEDDVELKLVVAVRPGAAEKLTLKWFNPFRYDFQPLSGEVELVKEDTIQPEGGYEFWSVELTDQSVATTVSVVDEQGKEWVSWVDTLREISG